MKKIFKETKTLQNSKKVLQKSNTCIFVEKEEQIEVVEHHLKEMDKMEFEEYYPEKGIVRLYGLGTELPYNGKFSFDLKEFERRMKQVGFDYLFISVNEHSYEPCLDLKGVTKNYGIYSELKSELL